MDPKQVLLSQISLPEISKNNLTSFGSAFAVPPGDNNFMISKGPVSVLGFEKPFLNIIKCKDCKMYPIQVMLSHLPSED